MSDPGEDGAALTTTAPLDEPPVSKAGAPRLLIVEDHPLFRAALVGVIGAEFPEAEVLQATSIDGALDVIAAREGLDLILLDLSMPGTTGLLGAYRVRAAAPRSALVIVSAHDDSRIIGSTISLGISGYIPKSTPKAELARLLRGILEGAVCLPTRFRDTAAARKGQADTRELIQQLGQLTSQQLRVLDMICHGLQNKHIAYQLDISVTTVKVHVSEILRKLNVRSRTEAIIALSKLDFGKHDHAPVTAAPSRGDQS
ncbi:response regulator transcription factor [Bradyrhizobium sp. ISRA436]|nr:MULTISPECIES: response regulator transcription factor [unclassified Bradyrhizobium]WGR94910.1 response regulator transcription factor [Bradyrhizobium sp. ISRA435]WGR99773.1 response regulator transcription factor [Bradyrhizobium sp. ISRA436]WGS06663.1 response regulator transcription factor [Bradyrhizobium sp. ISRA437]